MLVDPITDKEFVLEHSHLIHELVPGGSKLINRLIANGFTLEDSYCEQIEDASLVGEGKSLAGCVHSKICLGHGSSLTLFVSWLS